MKDIVTALASGTHPQRMRELVREPIYASEDTRLEWLRREFQRRRVHIAIILGPGHAFTGIVTLEDLVEEVLGEIQDEQDLEEIPPITRNADGSFEADGRLTLDVAARDLGLVFPKLPPEVETLGGFIVTQLSELPCRATKSRPWAFTSPCSTCAIAASAVCTPCRFPPRSPRSQKVDALYFW